MQSFYYFWIGCGRLSFGEISVFVHAYWLETVFVRSTGGWAYECVCKCVCAIHLSVQTLNPVSAKNMRGKHFDRFSSRPRRGTLDVTAILFIGGRKVSGGLSLLKQGDAGEKDARLHFFQFVFQH